MTRDEILASVQGVFVEMFELEPAKVHLDARLIEDLDLVPWRHRFDPLVACGRSDVLIYRCHGTRAIYWTGPE